MHLLQKANGARWPDIYLCPNPAHFLSSLNHKKSSGFARGGYVFHQLLLGAVVLIQFSIYCLFPCEWCMSKCWIQVSH